LYPGQPFEATHVFRNLRFTDQLTAALGRARQENFPDEKIDEADDLLIDD